ncbi:MAG: hypothetical protein JXP34_06475 [Planctomycetes bacterium]|nr:hypothetical protein [Planctomycetota bacterium]
MQGKIGILRWILIGVNGAGILLLGWVIWRQTREVGRPLNARLVSDASSYRVVRDAPRRSASLFEYDPIVSIIEPPPRPEPESPAVDEETPGSEESAYVEGGPLDQEWEISMTLGPRDPLLRAAVLQKKVQTVQRIVGGRTIVRPRTASRRGIESVMVHPGESYELDEGAVYTIERVTPPPDENVYYRFMGDAYVLSRDLERDDPRFPSPEEDAIPIQEIERDEGA